jgi:hypothetical protein
MIILDCENYTSTINSLVEFYNVSAQDIEGFFQSFDIDNHCEVNNPDGTGDQELRDVFENKLKLQPKNLDKVCWFHLTRALPEENFNEGIFPLSKSIDKVWGIFLSVFKGTAHYNNLMLMKNLGVDDFQYNHKVGVDSLAGPYAMLVKDVAFNSESTCNHDYLRIPEIMEDICNGYQKKFNVSIIIKGVRTLYSVQSGHINQ